MVIIILTVYWKFQANGIFMQDWGLIITSGIMKMRLTKQMTLQILDLEHKLEDATFSMIT